MYSICGFKCIKHFSHIQTLHREKISDFELWAKLEFFSWNEIFTSKND